MESNNKENCKYSKSYEHIALFSPGWRNAKNRWRNECEGEHNTLRPRDSTRSFRRDILISRKLNV